MRRMALSGLQGIACILLALVLTSTDAIAETDAPPGILVFQSDFGLADGAVSAMHGVALDVSTELVIEDLTHEIPAFDVWQASYRLWQTASFWPAGTVFVSVVDPGVGTERKSVVMLSETGHYFVTPDNGTLTLPADNFGMAAIREIDETLNRRAGSEASHTFHGRDVYAFVGARLAAGTISFEQVGPALDAIDVRLSYQTPGIESGQLLGNIPILDIRYGNVWTNIPESMLEGAQIQIGNIADITIYSDHEAVFEGSMPYASTFGDVETGAPLLYVNSLGNLAVALNMGDFAATHGIGSGPDWDIVITLGDD